MRLSERPLARQQAVALVLALLCLVTPTPRAAASISNCTAIGGAGNYFDGMLHDGGATLGVSANLTVRHPFVCTTDTSINNFSTSWTMLSGNRSLAEGWLQSGFFRSYGYPIQHISQFYNPHFYGGPVTWFGDVVQENTVHRYWQQYLPDAQGEFHSNVDTTRLINTTPGVLTYGWTSFSQIFMGETGYRSNDVPGYATPPNRKGHFTGISYQSILPPYSFILIPNPFLSAFNSNVGRWSVGPTSSTSFDIWSTYN